MSFHTHKYIRKNLKLPLLRVKQRASISNNMPTYKLMYFEVKGRAEVIRMALTVAGQEFEDIKRFTGRQTARLLKF